MNTVATPPLPAGRYATICADPPWTFSVWSDKGKGRSAERHYDVMSLADIKALPVGDIAAPDCALFLWAINSMLPQAFGVIEAWGFTFRTVAFTWAKRVKSDTAWHMGLGYWTRQNSESCLLATRGKPKRVSKGERELIVAPRREHSRKPDEAYERIERLLPGPYLDLFSRQTRPGWTAWGNQPNHFESEQHSIATKAMRRSEVNEKEGTLL